MQLFIYLFMNLEELDVVQSAHLHERKNTLTLISVINVE
jgi:hypothetical protein